MWKQDEPLEGGEKGQDWETWLRKGEAGVTGTYLHLQFQSRGVDRARAEKIATACLDGLNKEDA